MTLLVTHLSIQVHKKVKLTVKGLIFIRKTENALTTCIRHLKYLKNLEKKRGSRRTAKLTRVFRIDYKFPSNIAKYAILRIDVPSTSGSTYDNSAMLQINH